MVMKKDHLTDEKVYAAADKLMAEMNCTPDELTGHAVAKSLGKVGANPSVQAKFRDWQRKRNAELAAPAIEIPEEMAEALQALTDEQQRELHELNKNLLGEAFASMQQTASLLSSTAIKRLAAAEAQVDELTGQLLVAETSRDEAVAQVEQLECELKEARREIEALAASNSTLRELFDQSLRSFSEAQAQPVADRESRPQTASTPTATQEEGKGEENRRETVQFASERAGLPLSPSAVAIDEVGAAAETQSISFENQLPATPSEGRSTERLKVGPFTTNDEHEETDDA